MVVNLVEVNNYVRSNQVDANEKMFGVAKDRNLIVVSIGVLTIFCY